MSIFAGALSRRRGQEISGSLISQLRSAVSRYPGDAEARVEFLDDHVAIVGVDVGDQNSRHVDAARLAWTAGDPILQMEEGGPAESRSDALRRIADDLAAGRSDVLRSCRGTYCFLLYQRHTRTLYLATDKLGVRPIYCWVSPTYVVFSTALRILEALSDCSRTLNLKGIAEIGCFGYPLADRSPYNEIFTMRGGEIVQVDESRIHRELYWRWDDLPTKEPSKTAWPPETLHEKFVEAVRLRLKEQRVAAAFLSGGLDSRAIVATLKALGVETFTANFAEPGSQDRDCGRLAGEKLGVNYSELQRIPGFDGDVYSTHSVKSWLQTVERASPAEVRPLAVWSGDGGSVGLGHVYLNSDIVALSRAGDMTGAIRAFLAFNRRALQTRLLKHDVGARLSALMMQGLRDELASFRPADRGRTFYLFLMLNDQRRHMFNHFENLDITRTELEMPFFDSEFVAAVLREPIDAFLRHAFYHEWLKCFQPEVLEAPWQAYPGHIPCPLPLPEGLSYQWERASLPKMTEHGRRSILAEAQMLQQDRSFARDFIDPRMMLAFILLTRWTTADRSYLINAPSVLHKYWSRVSATGRHAMA